MRKRIGEDLEGNDSEVNYVLEGFPWTPWIISQKFSVFLTTCSILEIPDRKTESTCLGTGCLWKEVTGFYIWKQALMTQIGSFVHITDTPYSKVLNANAWQHMSVCLFVCFPNDTPLHLRTGIISAI